MWCTTSAAPRGWCLLRTNIRGEQCIRPPLSFIKHRPPHRLFGSKISARLAAATRSSSGALTVRFLTEAESGISGDEYITGLAGEAVRATQQGLEVGDCGCRGGGTDDEDCAMFAYGEGPLPVVRASAGDV